MSDYAIKVENLGKQYYIGERERYLALRDVITNGMRHPWNFIKNAFHREEQETIWALRNVNFTVKQGESLGIIGMNGAGKTTLLRILTRITDPTEGRAIIRGRVSSLLEVGTGFHPELTGRENIFVNGVLLGMQRAEVNRKLNDIIEFSGIDKFIDTPVKRYSSGMQLRLAFSVAAHLEPEIVLIDEVLAVGDVQFQNRCIDKMQEMSGEGKTILYVSHNLPSVSNLCDRAIILREGKVASDGPANDIVENYLNNIISVSNGIDNKTRFAEAAKTDDLRLVDVAVTQDEIDRTASGIDIAKKTTLEITYEVFTDSLVVYPSFWLFDQHGSAILGTSDTEGMSANTGYTQAHKPHKPGIYKASCEFPANFFNDKRYHGTVILGDGQDFFYVHLDGGIEFSVHDSGEMRQHYLGDWIGSIRPRLHWSTLPVS